MKVPHLTLQSGHVLVRDTDEIFPETIEHFKKFEIKSGSVTHHIERTPLECKVTVYGQACAFTFYIIDTGEPIVSCYCSLGPHGSDDAWGVVMYAVSKSKLFSDLNPVRPKGDYWICADVIGLSSPDTMSLIGEISFYVWNALYIANRS